MGKVAFEQQARELFLEGPPVWRLSGSSSPGPLDVQHPCESPEGRLSPEDPGQDSHPSIDRLMHSPFSPTEN